MAGEAVSVLMVFTPTLILLAWQQVSDFMTGAPEHVLVLMVFTPTLVLLA